MKTTQFTKAEVNHLLGLLEINEREGFYFGNKQHYFNRHDKIKNKLKIDFISSSLQLKEKEKTTFDIWLQNNKYIQSEDPNLYKYDGIYFNKQDLLQIFNAEMTNL
ncbi:hypothetical protein [uncultured Lutibacter sp.]|uniref:hypothetical protein n=1 Tax=uncultured Lutibacter sp. TaxID=437739 RepID=UPI00260EE638|nr:hypothetical protein [uncultured Lutibacter sp.]